MSVRVKICGLTRIEDAEAALKFGADALGFVMDPTSPRYVGARAKDLLGAVGPYAYCVAVFNVFATLDAPGINAVQMSDFEGTGSLLASVGLSRLPPIIKTLRVREGDEPGLSAKLLEDWLRHHHVEPRGVLLDAYHPTQGGGSGRRIDLDFAAEFVKACPRRVILAGGLTPENVAEAIQRVQPYAVDVSGGVETAPGIKDRIKLRDFIQGAKSSGLA